MAGISHSVPSRCVDTFLGKQCQPDVVVVGALNRWFVVELASVGAAVEDTLRSTLAWLGDKLTDKKKRASNKKEL